MNRAVIFDLDGTILLNEPAYCAAFKFVLVKLGVKVEVPCPQTIGLALEENWIYLLKKYHITTRQTPQDLVQATQNQYLKHLDQVQPAPGLYELLANLKNDNWLLALATSNHWWLVETELEHFHLEDKFDTITSREEVLFPKPAPRIFLETADKLQIEPEHCIVVENSVVGIQAAVAAGMKSVAIVWPEQPKDKLTTAGAHLTISSLAELTPQLLASLL